MDATDNNYKQYCSLCVCVGSLILHEIEVRLDFFLTEWKDANTESLIISHYCYAVDGEDSDHIDRYRRHPQRFLNFLRY